MRFNELFNVFSMELLKSPRGEPPSVFFPFHIPIKTQFVKA